MGGLAYYNEIDPYAAAWLRNLIAAGHIAPGVVDERSIVDVRPSDLFGFTQCHFFAGIGVWSYALRRAGWPDDRPVWTGSCPCQPFSAAGAGGGFDDERHLWPHWHHLIRVCRPPNVLGEQVASKDGLGWLDLVQSDMEGEGYALWPVDLCAAGVGAPHIRQRLWFVGQDELADPARLGERPGLCDRGQAGLGGYLLAHGGSERRQRGQGLPAGRVHDGQDAGRIEGHDGPVGVGEAGLQRVPAGRPGPTNGHWGAADWLFCRDGKWRPVEPESFPLAHGAPARVGRLRAYGNAIVAEAAQAVIETYLEHEADAAEARDAGLIGHNGGPTFDDVLG